MMADAQQFLQATALARGMPKDVEIRFPLGKGIAGAVAETGLAARVDDVYSELMNRMDGNPFDDKDEQRFARFLESLGVILETLETLSGVRTKG